MSVATTKPKPKMTIPDRGQDLESDDEGEKHDAEDILDEDGEDDGSPSGEDEAEDEAEDRDELEDGAQHSLEAPNIDPVPVTGVVRGLAHTLRPNDTLLLAITRLEDDKLLVSIQPPHTTKDSTAKSNLPMQVTGTPQEIDTQLVEALAHYVPARKFVIATAEETARQTAAAAAAAKEKAQADKRRPERASGKTGKAVAPVPAPKPKTGELLVGLTPRDATLKVTDDAEKEHGVKRGEIAKLPIGAYTIVASKDGFEEAKRTVTIVEDPKQIVAIELTPTAPTLFE